MNLTIRQENEKDFKQIYNFVKDAFKTAKVSDGHEQDFVNQLRASENYIPNLALVAEVDNQIIGHIMLTRYTVQDEDHVHEVLLLAPLAVGLNDRHQGVGSKLIKKSFKLAREMGYTAALLVGDPAYYHRFGFKTSTDFGITCLNKIAPHNVQACELVENALANIKGTVQF